MNKKAIQAFVQQRIESSVSTDPATGCWVWGRQVSNSGYGRIMIRDEGGTHMMSAQRASYEAFRGPIPSDSFVVQSCCNRLCVNPDHLELVPRDRNIH